MDSWLLLAYKVPREPSANRVYVWRKLKRLGALLLHDAIWLLPDLPPTREQLRWLASEIEELGGQATVWESRLASDGQHDALAQQFTERVNESYRGILKELKRKDADLAALSKQYQQVSAQDYFHAELGRRVREALMAAGARRKS